MKLGRRGSCCESFSAVSDRSMLRQAIESMREVGGAVSAQHVGTCIVQDKGLPLNPANSSSAANIGVTAQQSVLQATVAISVLPAKKLQPGQ